MDNEVLLAGLRIRMIALKERQRRVRETVRELMAEDLRDGSWDREEERNRYAREKYRLLEEALRRCKI